MAKVVGERDRFRQILIQRQRPRDRAGDGGHLHGVCEARAEVIAGTIQENLRLVLQPSKGAGMDDARAVALIGSPVGMLRLRVLATCRGGAELGIRCERLLLALLKLLAGANHRRMKGRAAG